MPLRYVEELTDAVKSQLALALGIKDQIGYGLRQRLKQGYTRADLRADAMAGVVVGVVALPLSMALAIASGVAPQHGLYTAIIAGLICALLGGTQMQVTGPTAAFVVILVPIVKAHGIAGLLVAGAMAGGILILMGVARLGKLMQFIPHPVTTGFTAGIAVVIAILQLGNVFGVTVPRSDGAIEYLQHLWDIRSGIHWADVVIAGFTLAALAAVPRFTKRIPAPLIALAAAAVLALVLAHLFASFEVVTIRSKFTSDVGGTTVHGIPPLPPMPMLPWQATENGSSGHALTFALCKELLPSAFAIAMLGAIESLMSAVVADGMSGTKHDPNAELIALGVANLVCPFFGGIAATGALARTATNIRAGARSPFAAAIHALFVLTCTIVLAPLVGYLPMAAMAALLLMVAKNMSEARHFVRLLRTAPRSDVMVLLTCFTLTVVFDMVIAVSVGVVLAALLFMRRMAIMTKVSLDSRPHPVFDVPPGIHVYEIAGPLFFGAARTAMETLETIHSDVRVVILNMSEVPVMDATGMIALETILDRHRRSRRKTILCGLQPSVTELLDRAGIRRIPGALAFAPDLDTALSMAIVHSARDDEHHSGPSPAAPAPAH